MTPHARENGEARGDTLRRLAACGLGPRRLRAIDRLVVGAGGLVKEILAYSRGASRVKDSSGQRLSDADELAEEFLCRQLQAMDRRFFGYGEERKCWGRDPGRGRRAQFFLDAVDGTRCAAALQSGFAVTAGALARDDDGIAGAVGWVYLPHAGQLFRGAVGPALNRCTVNGRPVSANTPAAESLRNGYLGISSDWNSAWLPGSELKVTGLGATAVHLAQLCQRNSDVLACSLTRYRAHDALGGLVVAAAGGCRVYRVRRGSALPEGEPAPLLELLREQTADPEARGFPLLVCRPEVAEALRRGAAARPD